MRRVRLGMKERAYQRSKQQCIATSPIVCASGETLKERVEQCRRELAARKAAEDALTIEEPDDEQVRISEEGERFILLNDELFRRLAKKDTSGT